MINRSYDLSISWDNRKTCAVFSSLSPERFFRLNPHWVINGFQVSEQSFTADITDHETEQSFTITGTYLCNSDGFTEMHTEDHLCTSISFCQKNDNLHADVLYSSEPDEEAERRIVLWLRSVKEYLRLYATDSLNTRFFRMLMNRVILQMTPSQRKISLMLVRITVLELLVILVILIGWFFFLK